MPPRRGRNAWSSWAIWWAGGADPEAVVERVRGLDGPGRHLRCAQSSMKLGAARPPSASAGLPPRPCAGPRRGWMRRIKNSSPTCPTRMRRRTALHPCRWVRPRRLALRDERDGQAAWPRTTRAPHLRGHTHLPALFGLTATEKLPHHAPMVGRHAAAHAAAPLARRDRRGGPAARWLGGRLLWGCWTPARPNVPGCACPMTSKQRPERSARPACPKRWPPASLRVRDGGRALSADSPSARRCIWAAWPCCAAQPTSSTETPSS